MTQIELHDPVMGLVWLVDAWPIFQGLVDADDSVFTYDEIEHAISTGHMQLWTITDRADLLAAVITQINAYNDKLVCHILLCAGRDMSIWLHHISEVESWAKEQGASLMRIQGGRNGWEKVLPGYKKSAIVLTKELSYAVQ